MKYIMKYDGDWGVFVGRVKKVPKSQELPVEIESIIFCSFDLDEYAKQGYEGIWWEGDEEILMVRYYKAFQNERKVVQYLFEGSINKWLNA
jgi:hypothetical protein